MSYFKPLNSNENNLHIIRASIDSTGNIVFPSINQLPYNFSIERFGNIANTIVVHYPNVYNSTDIPSVFVEAINSVNSSTETKIVLSNTIINAKGSVITSNIVISPDNCSINLGDATIIQSGATFDLLNPTIIQANTIINLSNTSIAQSNCIINLPDNINDCGYSFDQLYYVLKQELSTDNETSTAVSIDNLINNPINNSINNQSISDSCYRDLANINPNEPIYADCDIFISNITISPENCQINTAEMKIENANFTTNSSDIEIITDNPTINISNIIITQSDCNITVLSNILIDVDLQNTPQLRVTNKQSGQCTISTAATTLPAFDIIIIGTKASGPVFAVSNRGWKYTNNIKTNDIIYSDMLVGVNTDSPNYNLSVNGNFGILPNKVNSSNINIQNIINNTMNVINLDASLILKMLAPKSDGEILHLFIGSISTVNSNITLDITSNISTSSNKNIILQNIGDSVSLYSFNNYWLLYNLNVTPVNTNILTYNNYAISSYEFNSFVNGYLSVVTIDKNMNIDLPISTNYNGLVFNMVVSNIVNNSNINFVLSNITTNKNSLVLSNVCDSIKLLCTGNKWLQVN